MHIILFKKKDDKYEYRVGSQGTKISGGEKQRISIARMLMTKPKLMLLDEATSSLDAESEAIVQAALDELINDNKCTVIIVAHRLSTVVNADKIVVIDDGEVIEEGNHNQLMNNKKVYARLVDRQINLKAKMKQKLANSKDPNARPIKDDDFDTIDKLIDQMKKKKNSDPKKNNTNAP